MSGHMSGRTGGQYCITLDDNIRFLEETERGRLGSVTDHPYIAQLKRCHEQYGAVFQLNMFYSYEPGGFSLDDVSTRYRDEFDSLSGWLKMSFHSLNNRPRFPYDGVEPGRLAEDYGLVTSALRRIAGRAAETSCTTLHYACAGREACGLLREAGVRGLIGMFTGLPGREGLRYYLDQEAEEAFEKSSFFYDESMDLLFVRNDLILNKLEPEEIGPSLERLEGRDFWQIMTHEQYFYQDYERYQPDFERKLTTALEWMGARGAESVFLDQILEMGVETWRKNRYL